MPDDSRLIFGVQEEWSAFGSRHKVFLERFTNLRSAIDCAFAGDRPLSEPIDKFIFLFGRICAEEFFEILLCCGNGYGFAAQKLLRSLYEKAVTLAYLHQNPEQLDDFIDYHHVASYKLARAVKES
jgi:hypothetical protein